MPKSTNQGRKSASPEQPQNAYERGRQKFDELRAQKGAEDQQYELHLFRGKYRREMSEIYVELVELMKMPGSHRDQFATCDLIGQDELYEIQDKVAALTLKVANMARCAEDLADTFPHIYSRN
jgi:hypothetical protein